MPRRITTRAERVAPVPLREVAAAADRVRLTLQPASWNVIRLAAAAGVSGGDRR